MAGCVEIQNDLSAYLDGELPAGERGALEAHLRGCAACQTALNDLKSVTVSLATLPKVKAPSNFAAKLSQELRKEAAPARAGKVVSLTPAAPHKTWLTPSVMSIAALLMVAVLVFAVLPGLDKRPPPATNVAVQQEPRPARKADAPMPFAPEAPEVERLQKKHDARKNIDGKRPMELGEQAELQQLSKDLNRLEEGKPAADKLAEEPAVGGALLKDTETRGRPKEEWAASRMPQTERAKTATKDGAAQQHGEQKGFGTPAPAQAPRAAAPAKELQDRTGRLADEDDATTPAAKGQPAAAKPQTAAPAAPPAATAAGQREALRRSAETDKDVKLGQVSLGDPGKPGAIGGGGGKAEGAPAAKTEANNKADSAPAKKSAPDRGPGEAAEEEAATPERKQKAATASAVAAPPAPSGAPGGKFRAGTAPVRVTIKSADPAALAARLRTTAVAAGATLADGAKARDKANAPAEQSGGAAKAGSQQVVITLTAPVAKRAVLLKEIAALQASTLKGDALELRKLEDALNGVSRNRGVAQADVEKQKVEKQDAKKNYAAPEDAAPADAKKPAPAEPAAPGTLPKEEERALTRQARDDAPKNAEAEAGGERLKELEETIQIIIVVEPE